MTASPNERRVPPGLAEHPLQLAHMGSSEELAAEIAAARERLTLRPDGTLESIAPRPQYSTVSEPEAEAPIEPAIRHEPEPEPEPESEHGTLTPILNTVEPNTMDLHNDEVTMLEPSVTPEAAAVEALRQAEQQLTQQLAEAQARITELDGTRERILSDIRQAESKAEQALAVIAEKKKDRESAERRLAEITLSTEQALKKLSEIEARLNEFKAAEEFAGRSRGTVEARVNEIRETIKQLNAELAQNEERAAKERLAEEHAANERASAAQRLEIERNNAQPHIEERQQAEEFVREDLEAERAAASTHEELLASLVAMRSTMEHQERDRSAALIAVTQLKNSLDQTIRDRVKAEREAAEAAAAAEQAEIERQLAELRAAEERAARERAAAERKLAELRAAQQRATLERQAHTASEAVAAAQAAPIANGKPATSPQDITPVWEDEAPAHAEPESVHLPEPPPPIASFVEPSPLQQAIVVETPQAPVQRAELPPIVAEPRAQAQIAEPLEESVELPPAPAPAKAPRVQTKIDSSHSFSVSVRKQGSEAANASPAPAAAAAAAATSAQDKKDDVEDAPKDLAEALRRAAEEQRAAAREMQQQAPAGHNIPPILSVFGRKKAPESAEAEGGEPQLSIAERIARDFGNLYDT